MLDVDDLSELVIREIIHVLIPEEHPVRCIREVNLAAICTKFVQAGVIAGFRCCENAINFVLQIPVAVTYTLECRPCLQHVLPEDMVIDAVHQCCQDRGAIHELVDHGDLDDPGIVVGEIFVLQILVDLAALDRDIVAVDRDVVVDVFLNPLIKLICLQFESVKGLLPLAADLVIPAVQLRTVFIDNAIGVDVDDPIPLMIRYPAASSSRQRENRLIIP